jgi:hypothetical protein
VEKSFEIGGRHKNGFATILIQKQKMPERIRAFSSIFAELYAKMASPSAKRWFQPRRMFAVKGLIKSIPNE